MTDPSKRFAVLGALLAAFVALPAQAGDDPKPAKPAERAAEAKAKGAEARAERADKAADAKDKAAERAAEGKEKGALGKEHADDKGGPPGRKMGHGKHGFPSGLHKLHMELREGKLKPEEVKERLAKLKESVKDRRKAHREAIKDRWGDALAKPNAIQELKHHARRMAFLNRALIVAGTERKGADKDKIVERIEKLIEKEQERHTSAMERIKSGAPAAASAAPAAASAAPQAAEKAGE